MSAAVHSMPILEATVLQVLQVFVPFAVHGDLCRLHHKVQSIHPFIGALGQVLERVPIGDSILLLGTLVLTWVMTGTSRGMIGRNGLPI